MSLRKVMLLAIALTCVGAASIAFAQDKVTLTYWSDASPDEAGFEEQTIAEFEQAHPNIAVNMEFGTGDWGEMHTQILVRMAAGTAPDVIMTPSDWVRTFALAKQGGFLDLAPYMQRDGLDPATTFYGVYNVGVVNGTPYVLTKDYSTTAIYINTDLFDEAGMPYPEEGWTWDDFIAVAQKLTLDANGNDATSPDFDPENIVQWGAFVPPKFGPAFSDLAYSYGAQELSDDGSTAVGYLDSETMAQAYEMWRDMLHKYHIAPSIAQIQAQPGVDLFATGQAAMRGPWGTWDIPTYAETPGLNFRIAPLPSGPKGHYGTVCWNGYGVNKDTDHPDEAWELLKWLGTEPGQLVFSQMALTSMPAVAEETGKALDPYWGPFLAESDHIYPAMDSNKVTVYYQCLGSDLDNLRGLLRSDEGAGVDPRPLLKDIAIKADACLAQNGM
jgi:multiple sugar transport system substrate-binding protein